MGRFLARCARSRRSHTPNSEARISVCPPATTAPGMEPRPGTSGPCDGPAGVAGGGGLELLKLGRGGTPFRFEAGGVPAGKARASLVGALAEREQRRSGVGCGSDGLVTEDSERAGAELDPRTDGQRLVAESLGFE